MIYCGMCGDTGLQNGVKCPQPGCRKANGLPPFDEPKEPPPPNPTALIPRFDLAAGIENFQPRCIVCTGIVPMKRSRGRSKDTCGPECHKILQQFRKWVTLTRYCPACYHPSTPDERKEFIAWRKHRGDLRPRRGRPAKEQTSALVQAMQELLAKAEDMAYALYGIDPGSTEEPEQIRKARVFLKTEDKSDAEEQRDATTQPGHNGDQHQQVDGGKDLPSDQDTDQPAPDDGSTGDHTAAGTGRGKRHHQSRSRKNNPHAE